MLKPKTFAKARQSMIDSQIHPMGVVSEKVLNAFAAVPREEFVPEEMKGICYCDEDLEILPGRYLMEASVLARMIQALELKPDEVILTIGAGIGYNAAVLSHLVSTVVALEEDDMLFGQAQDSWNKFNYCNIAAIKGRLVEGVADSAPYNAILINGAVCEISDVLKNQLCVGGRMIAIVKKAGQPMGKAVLVTRESEDLFTTRVLFDASTPYLRGFEPAKEFVF